MQCGGHAINHSLLKGQEWGVSSSSKSLCINKISRWSMNVFTADSTFITHGSAGLESTGLYQTRWEVRGRNPRCWEEVRVTTCQAIWLNIDTARLKQRVCIFIIMLSQLYSFCNKLYLEIKKTRSMKHQSTLLNMFLTNNKYVLIVHLFHILLTLKSVREASSFTLLRCATLFLIFSWSIAELLKCNWGIQMILS